MGLSEMAIEAWTKAEAETDTLRVIDMVTVSLAEKEMYMLLLKSGRVPSAIPSIPANPPAPTVVTKVASGVPGAEAAAAAHPSNACSVPSAAGQSSMATADQSGKSEPPSQSSERQIGGVKIRKRDRVQNGSEAYLFGVEVSSACKLKGAKRTTTVTSEHAADLKTQHELPLKNGTTCRLLETLSVVDHGAVMRQNFFAKNINTGNTCTIDRFFTRTEPLALDGNDDDDEDD